MCFHVRTSWRWCNGSCLFKGRQGGVIHLRASCAPVAHDVTVRGKIVSGGRLAGSAHLSLDRFEAADGFSVYTQAYRICVRIAGLWSGWQTVVDKCDLT